MNKRATEYRIAVVGGGGIGKSASVIQFIQNHFVEEYDPTIEDSYRKQIIVDGEAALLDILDTAGMEEYSAMRDQYLRSAQAILLMYSITSRQSFEEASTLRDQKLRIDDAETCTMVFSGNKNDLEEERQVTTAEAKALAKEWNCPFFETSAKLAHNITEEFEALTREIRKSAVNRDSSNSTSSTQPRRKPRIAPCVIQ